ncbi:G patch domain-containing protein 1 isoform X1 [Eleutherodactylus coqui]|uniref:G patch domain-containing protein 1 isoform X1 n=1 Tax=Eleutherodactylus coqui TaxID=57060 RepID=UPI00346305C2
MAARDSDGEEDFVNYGKPLEPYEEGEQPKRPIPLQDQTVKDEKGRYKRFHGAFTGGFSAGYFNTVGTKEGWTPSTFVSTRQGRSERQVSRPEDFMDDEDLGEFGIAPNEILTTDEFASKNKDRIREKARELASVTTPIPGATILEDLIAPAKITMGVQLLRQMGWKEGQGVGPRVKRRAQKQKPGGNVKTYGCALPATGSEESEDEDDYIPENITFAPKDVTPIDFTVKDNVHGLGYRGLNPHQALFGSLDTHINIFSDGSEKTSSLLGDIRHSKGRKVGISGQAFGVGAMEDEDDDIYSIDPLSKYDTVLREEETGDGLFGWTAPKEYKNRKSSSKELQYIGKMLEGFCLATQSPPSKKIYPPPDLPRDYRPVHYFRPVLAENSQNSAVLQAMIGESSLKPGVAPVKEQPAGRHQLNSSQRRDMLGEAPLQGPTSVLELLSEKDRERIQDVKHTLEEQRSKAQKLAQEALKKRFQASAVEEKFQQSLLDRQMVPEHAEEFRPFEKNSEKQKRYENYIRSLHKGEKDALESCLDTNMTEWERSREREEFMRSAMLYKPTNSHLSSRFTRGKYEDDTDTVDVPRDQEGDVNDKAAAVKMKMFGKLTRDKFEWHPDRLLCKRFNVPDPYPGSTIIGLPKIKRDKYSVFNFLTIPETQPPTNTIASARPEKLQQSSGSKPKKSSRWDMSGAAEEKKKDSVSEFLSLERSKSEVAKEEPDTKPKDSQSAGAAVVPAQGPSADTDQSPEEEEKRPPIDLFKAIFAESSDEKSSSSDEESDEDPTPVVGADAETSKSEAATSSRVQAPESAAKLLAPPPVPAATEGLEEMDVGEFGPKLPPISGGPPMPSSYSSGSVSEPTKKQKHKKHKEKHKVKKEHKHKKEKKKKHKKQKHKSKQKSRKTDDKSTDTDDSSESPSESENTGDITPRELLKRLKNLPIPHSQL